MTQNIYSEQEKNNEKRRLVLHLLLLFIIGILCYSSFLGITNMTTTLLAKDNLGIIGLTVSNVIELLVTLFIVAWINRVWEVKKVLTFGVFVSILYPLSFFYPISYIIMLGSLSRGIGFALILSGIYIYGSKFVYRYHHNVGGNLTILTIVLSSLVTGSVGGGFLFGNIIEFLIFNSNVNTNSSETEKNICGTNYCNEDLSNLTTMHPPLDKDYYTVIGIYSVIILLASVLCLLLEALPSEIKGNTLIKEFINEMKITFKQALDPRGYLLIVITMLVGALEAFKVTVFTYAYITCNLGLGYIGKIMMSYGFASICMCFCNWLLVKTFKRVPTLAIGCLIIIGCFLTLLLFPFATTNNLETVFIVLSATYAVAVSIIASTTFSMYALMFPEDFGVSFGLACLWLTVGSMICNATNLLLCVSAKLYIFIAIVVLGFILFSYLEYLIHRGMFSTPASNHEQAVIKNTK